MWGPRELCMWALGTKQVTLSQQAPLSSEPFCRPLSVFSYRLVFIIVFWNEKPPEQFFGFIDQDIKSNVGFNFAVVTGMVVISHKASSECPGGSSSVTWPCLHLQSSGTSRHTTGLEDHVPHYFPAVVSIILPSHHTHSGICVATLEVGSDHSPTEWQQVFPASEACALALQNVVPGHRCSSWPSASWHMDKRSRPRETQAAPATRCCQPRIYSEVNRMFTYQSINMRFLCIS